MSGINFNGRISTTGNAQKQIFRHENTKQKAVFPPQVKTNYSAPDVAHMTLNQLEQYVDNVANINKAMGVDLSTNKANKKTDFSMADAPTFKERYENALDHPELFGMYNNNNVEIKPEKFVPHPLYAQKYGDTLDHPEKFGDLLA